MSGCSCFVFVAIAVVILVLLLWAMRRRVMGEGFTTPGIDPQAIITTYTKYMNANGPKIVVGIHKTSWCGACKNMEPIWNQLKADLAGQNIQFVENDEEKNPTPWVTYYPTIVRISNGTSSVYQGRANYQDLRNFVLNTNMSYNE